MISEKEKNIGQIVADDYRTASVFKSYGIDFYRCFDRQLHAACGCLYHLSVAFALLKEFEDDLHLHIHLENNILFPKAIELEKELSYA